MKDWNEISAASREEIENEMTQPRVYTDIPWLEGYVSGLQKAQEILQKERNLKNAPTR